MIHFDQALTAARDVLLADPVAPQIDEVLVLRDLRGRIRLFLTPVQGGGAAVEKACGRLGAALSQAVQPFWGDVVEVYGPRSTFQKLLEPVLQEKKPILPQAEFPKWSIIERHAAKSAWAGGAHDPPWPLNDRTPPIVAFFSHKGGVGRTTALCATAVNLAQSGTKVVAVDLDLEAPGLGSLLSGAAVEYGVTDYLLERMVAGAAFAPNSNIDPYAVRQADPALIGETGEPIVCVPAGRINEHYIEKLARLDYELLVPHPERQDNPLGDLLEYLKRRYEPGFILIDCRAGLHDLGGLAVHGLSHASVIFGLDSRQSWDGLRCLVRRLGFMDPPRPPCLLIQAMEDGKPGPRQSEARQRFKEQSYEVFCEEYYDEDEVPDIGSTGEAHDAFPLAYDERLSGYQTLGQVVSLLRAEPYVGLVERVKQLVGKAMNNVCA